MSKGKPEHQKTSTGWLSLFYFKTSEVIIPIVRMLDGIVYDQEGGTPISISEKGDKVEVRLYCVCRKEKAGITLSSTRED